MGMRYIGAIQAVPGVKKANGRGEGVLLWDGTESRGIQT